MKEYFDKYYCTVKNNNMLKALIQTYMIPSYVCCHLKNWVEKAEKHVHDHPAFLSLNPDITAAIHGPEPKIAIGHALREKGGMLRLPYQSQWH